MKVEEICVVCRMMINTKRDNFINLIDYKQGKFFAEGFYHTQCYNDKIKGGEDMKKMKAMTFGLLKKARSIVGVEEPTQVVEIK